MRRCGGQRGWRPGRFAGTWRTPSKLRALIRQTEEPTSHPIGVHLILVWPCPDLLTVFAEDDVRVISF